MAESMKEAQRDLKQIQDGLEDTEAIAKVYAQAMLSEAISRASGRPTPQAPMASEAMGIQGTHISVLTGGDPAAVSGGSEWGSDIYPQFGPRNESGWWLMPAGESESVKHAADAYLEEVMDRAIGTF